MDINNLRKEYRLQTLTVKSLKNCPFSLLQDWLEQARQAHIIEPNAMILATASAKGIPSSRTVLLKEIKNHSLIFFTNYTSRKAQEIKENPYVSATFLWKEIEKQVTLEGTAATISREETAAYFSTRPRGSQIAAWASKQGQEIPDRAHLEALYQSFEKKFRNKTIPVPTFWGGIAITPQRFVFWQGRENRLHDRFLYLKKGKNQWKISRLAP